MELDSGQKRKLLIAVEIILILTVIGYIRLEPKLGLDADQYAFWGCTGDFLVRQEQVYQLESLPAIDPKYNTFSSLFHEVSFAYTVLWTTLFVFLRNISLSSELWITGKVFTYSLGILGSFTSYLLAKRILRDTRIALLSALFVNLVPYYIVWTDITRYMVLAVPLIPLSLYFLLAGVEERKSTYILLSGFVSACVLMIHPFSYWVLNMTYLVLLIAALVKSAVLRKFQDYEVVAPLSALTLSYLLFMPAVLSLIKNMFNSGWLENSRTTMEQYLGLMGLVPLLLTLAGMLFALYGLLKKKYSYYAILILFAWAFSAWWGLEAVRVGEPLVKEHVKAFVGDESLQELLWRFLAPLKSSRYYVHLAQPASIFACIAVAGFMSMLGRVRFQDKRFKYFLVLLLLALATYYGGLHSYHTSKNYVSIVGPREVWSAIRFVCDELPEDARVLSEVGFSETLMQKCNKYFTAYYIFASDPWTPYYKITNYVYSGDSSEGDTLAALEHYGLDYVFADGSRKSKFEGSDCFSRVFEDGYVTVYKVGHSCSSYKKISETEWERIDNEIKR